MGAVGDESRALEVLGPTVVRFGGEAVDLRRRERDVLAALALPATGPADTLDLANALWPEEPPATATVTIQNHIARLRQRLGADAIATEAGGYRLGDGWALDVDRQDVLLSTSARWGRLRRPDLAVEALDEAISLSRGPAFADLVGGAAATARARYAARLRAARDDLLVCLLAAGDTTRITVEGPELCEAEPFRELRWAILALALYRDGQRRESIRVLRRSQDVLRDRVGLDPGPLLRRLESLVLDDDPDLTEQPSERVLETVIDRVGGRRGRPLGPPALPIVDRLTTEADLTAAARVATDDLRFTEAAMLWQAAADRSAQKRGAAAKPTMLLRLQQAEALRLAGDPTGTTIARELINPAMSTGGGLLARVATELCRLGPLSAAGHVDLELASVVETAIEGCDDVALRADCESQATLFYSMSGRIDRAHHHYERSLVDARSSGDDRVLLRALAGTYPILTHPRDQQRRAELASEMLALADRLDDDDGRFSALHLYFAIQVIGADPLVRTTFRHEEHLAQRLHSASRRWMLSYHRTCIAHLEGRLDDALEIAGDAYATAPVAPSRAQAERGMTILLVHFAQGRAAELADDVDAAIASQPGLPGWRAAAAWIAACSGNRERVISECDALGHGTGLPEDMTWGAAAMLLARAAAAVDHTEALAPLRDLISPYTGTFSWYGSGTVGPFDLALAELELALGNVASARTHLEAAQKAVDRLGAVVFRPDLDEIRDRLR